MKYLFFLLFFIFSLNHISAHSDQQIKPVNSTNIIGESLESIGSEFVNNEIVTNRVGEVPEDKYVKDSLRILLVKLMGLKKLDEKNLLYTDISANFPYYSELLEEFKDSEIVPADYLYLEQTIAQISNERLDRKYKMSLGANLVLGFGLLGLLFYIWKRPSTKESPILKVELSNQELKVKSLILEGKSNKEIAEALFVSLSTIKTHISNLYKKTGVTNRSELMNL